jgi:hypothetical protein
LLILRPLCRSLPLSSLSLSSQLALDDRRLKSIYVIGSLRNPEVPGIGIAIRQLGYDVQQQTINGCDMKKIEIIPMPTPSPDTLPVMFIASINLISIAAMLPFLFFLAGSRRILN